MSPNSIRARDRDPCAVPGLILGSRAEDDQGRFRWFCFTDRRGRDGPRMLRHDYLRQ